MKRRLTLFSAGMLLVLTGCDAAEISTTEDAADETETKYAVVESNDDESVVISFSDHTTTAIPEDDDSDSSRITVLKDSCTISMDDLSKDDSLMVTYYKGEISAIQVIDDFSDQNTAETDDSLTMETAAPDHMEQDQENDNFVSDEADQ